MAESDTHYWPHLRIRLQLPGVWEAPLVSGVGQPLVDEVELVLGAQQRPEAMESVPLCDVVRQDGGVGVALVRLDLDVEMVCEHLLGLACCEKQMEDTEEDGTDSLVVTEGGGKGVARPPPSLTARWEG